MLVNKTLGWPLGYLDIFPYRFHKDPRYKYFTNKSKRQPRTMQERRVSAVMASGLQTLGLRGSCLGYGDLGLGLRVCSLQFDFFGGGGGGGGVGVQHSEF